MSAGRKAILVVSFGTSYNDNRRMTIGAIESDIARAFRDWEVRRAFTSKMIIRKLAERDGEKIDYITEALERLSSDGFGTVVVQPTHVMNGKEYDDVVDAVTYHAGSFDRISIGRPLLTSESDYDAAVDAFGRSLVKDASDVAGDGVAIVMMGHGTTHFANSTYSQLHLKLQLSGYPNAYVTTVEGYPSFGDTVKLMEGKGYTDAVLFPFMLVAGDHANNDMAGDDEDSLSSVLSAEGYNVHSIVKGLGEYPEFRELFVGHVRDAMDALEVTNKE